MSTKEELLKSEVKYCAGAIIDFQAWYRKFRETDKETDLKKAFTIEVWDEWLQSGSSSVPGSLNLGQGVSNAVQDLTKNFDGLNVSYKVESKEIPKLPWGKSLKGKIFDEWHTNFLAKMSQARIDDIMEENFVRPLPTDPDYPLFKMKMDYLKNHLLTATISSNASSFIEPKLMDGLEMYKKLVSIFHGQEHTKDRVIQATAMFEKLRFDRHSRYSPELFLDKINDCLNLMKVDQKYGGTRNPVDPILLPSIFRAKINHPMYKIWKALSESKDESWEEMQVSFLRVA